MQTSFQMQNFNIKKVTFKLQFLILLINNSQKDKFFVFLVKRIYWPGGPVVKNPPSNAGDAGSIPGQGTKIPHAAGQPSPRATTTEPTRHN